MADETIPGIVIPVTGDFSDLNQSFADAISDAQQQGSQLAQALSSSVGRVADDFDSAFSKLVDGGASMDDAFQKLTGSTQSFMDAIKSGDLTGLVDQFNQMVNAANGLAGAEGSAASAAQAMANADQQLASAQGEANAQLAQAVSSAQNIQGSYMSAADSAAALAKSEADLGTAASSAAPALAQTGEAAESASGGFANMATAILALGGISLTIDALVDLAKSAVEASDKLDDAAYAIGRLNQGAMSGKDEIAGLLSIAQDEGLSFPGLVSAAQRMETLGIHGQDVVDALQKLGNASELTGDSIETMARKFTNLVDGANLSVKALAGIGLTTDEVKQQMIDMGANADLVQNHFKDLWKVMDETQHADVLKGALENLDGAAAAMNDDIKGDVQRTMNDFYASIAKLGDVIAPLAQKILPYLIDALKVLVIGVDAGVTSFKVLLDVLMGYAGVLKDVYTGLGEAANAISKADFAGAANAVTSAIDRIKGDMSDMSTKIQADIKAGADFAKQAWAVDMPDAMAKTSSAAKDTSNELAGVTVKTKEAQAAAKEYATEVSNLNTELGKINTVLGNVADSYDTYLKNLQDGGKTAVQQLKDIDTEIQNASNAALKLKDPAMIEGLQEWISKLKEARDTVKDFADQDAWNKLAGQIAGLAAKFPQQVGEMTGSLKTFVQAAIDTANQVPAAFNKIDPAALIGKWLEATKQLDDSNQKMGDHFQQVMNKYHEAATNQVSITVSLADRLNDVDKTLQGVAADASRAFSTTAIGQYYEALKELNAEGVKSVQQQQSQIQMYGDLIDKANQYKIPLGEILDLQAKQLQAAINLATEQGNDANTLVLALEKVRLKQEELKLSAHGLADEYVAMINDVLKGFDQMAGAMADAIVNGKSLEDALVNTFKKIAQSILTDLIQAALLPLKKELLELMTSLLPDLKSGLNATADGAKALSDAAKDAAASAEKMSASADKVSAALGDSSGSGGGTGLAGSVSHLASIISVVADVISAGAAVASTIILSHISSDTGHIEVNTRSTLAEVENVRADLWSQFGQMYQRLGEVKNGIDRLADLIGALSISAGGLSPTDSGNLQHVADNTQYLFAELMAIDKSTANLYAWLQQIDSSINNNFGLVLSELAVVNQSILQVVTSLVYAPTRQDITSQTSSATEDAHAITSAIEDGTAATVSATAAASGSRQRDDSAIIDRQNAILSAAQAQLQSSLTMDGQLSALREEYGAYQQLQAQAIKDGDFQLAQQYANAATQTSQQLTALIGRGDQMVSSANQTYDATVKGDSEVAYAATSAGTLISAHVDASATAIASAVAISQTAASAAFSASLASTLMGLAGVWGAVGGGTRTGLNGTTGGTSGQLPAGSGGGVAGPGYGPPSNANPGIPVGQQPGFGAIDPATGKPANTNITPNTDFTPRVTPKAPVSDSAIPTVEIAGVSSPAATDIAQAVAPNTARDKNAQGPATNAASFDPVAAAALTGQSVWEALQGHLDAVGAVNAQEAAARAANPQTGDTYTSTAGSTSISGPSGPAAPAGYAAAVTTAATAAATAAVSAALPAAGTTGDGMTATAAVPGSSSSLDQETLGFYRGALAEFEDIRTTIHGEKDLISSMRDSWVAFQTTSHNDAMMVGQAIIDTMAGKDVKPLKSFDMGGYVDSDMVAQVHAGEYVIPPDLTGALRRMVQTPSYSPQTPAYGGGGGRNITIHAPITISNARDGRSVAKEFVTHLKHMVPDAGAFSS